MIKLGHVGTGIWGRNVLRNFAQLEEVAVKLCCDKDVTSAEKFKQEHKLDYQATDNFSLLLDSAVDAIIIASSASTHADFAKKALKAGKHIFVEKPLALNLKDAQEIIEIAKEVDKKVMVGHLLLYHPAVNLLKQMVEAGDLGSIHYMYSARVNLGRIREEENALWSLTAHDISLANYMLHEVPVDISTNGNSYVRKGIQDVVFLNLNFKSEVMTHIHASWLDPHKVRKFTIVGSKKMAVFDDMEKTDKIKVYDKGYDWQNSEDFGTYKSFLTLRHGDCVSPKFDMKEPLRIECEHFIDCIKNNKKPLTDEFNGLSVLKVLDAAQKSLDSNGKRIKIHEK